MGKNCAICGKPSGIYPLCKDCFKLKDEGKISKCEECGTWYRTDEGCPNCNLTIKKQPEPAKEFSSDELTCIVCGKPSNGKHFCLNCYRSFRNKVLYLQVKKCTEFVKLEAEYESDFTCDDGHMVKSPYEKMIDDWLFKEKIQHGYETTYVIDGETTINPDFYIPEYKGTRDIYIEFWGYGNENIEYTKRKEYKERIYPMLCERDKITVLYLTKSDCNNLAVTLKQKLLSLKPYQINSEK